MEFCDYIFHLYSLLSPLLCREAVCEPFNFNKFFTALNAGSCSLYHIDLPCLNILIKMGAGGREMVSYEIIFPWEYTGMVNCTDGNQLLGSRRHRRSSDT